MSVDESPQSDVTVARKPHRNRGDGVSPNRRESDILAARSTSRPFITRALFVVGGLHTEGSGVARIVCDLANALARRGTSIDVYTALCSGQQAAGYMLTPPSRLHAARGRWTRLASSSELKRMLAAAVPSADVVHSHSLWMLPTSYASRAALRNRVPVMFTAHGFLEPWALARSRWKKRIAGICFQNRDLRNAACIHVNSEREARSIRAYGLRNPIAVIPNGVNMKDFEHLPDRRAFEQEFPEMRCKSICLFLSRLHEKKGLRHLIDAWRRVSVDFSNWHLLIAGPDDGFERRLRESIASFNLSASVTVAGPLYGNAKLAAYAAADAFVLPSFSEGFSMAVLEAMACKLPVLITPECNFQVATTDGAAVEVSPDVDGTELGLRRLLTMTDGQRQEMGRRGRALVESRYTWERVAAKTLEVYAWLAGGGAPPDTIIDE